MTRVALGDISLNVEATGEGVPLLLLHGFTGCAASWLPIAASWDGIRAIAVDVIGHGGSDAPSDPARYRMDRASSDLAELLDALDLERAGVLGYSMGGRLALHFALTHPDRVAALVLESASPGIDDPDERAARVRSDEELASRLEREGLEWFVDYWQSLPLWDSQKTLPPQKLAALRRQRLTTNSVRGLANSLRGMGAGVQPTLWGRLPELAMPCLFLAGALDQKYVEIALQMAAAVSSSRAEVIAVAGHAAHFEQPEAFSALVLDFLNSAVPRPQEV